MQLTSFRRIAAAVVVPMAMATVLVAPAAQATTSGSAASIMPGKSYSLLQVKKHHTPANCWSVVGRNVYNLTGWVKKHPGGSSTISAMCGKNATVAFNRKHRGSGTAKAALSRYKIGTLR
jgi:cytochrome b involved in lipid metabolism